MIRHPTPARALAAPQSSLERLRVQAEALRDGDRATAFAEGYDDALADVLDAIDSLSLSREGRTQQVRSPSVRYCQDCAAKALPGRTRCQAHLHAMRGDDAGRRARRAAAGLCRKCEAPAIEGRRVCAVHLEAERAKNAKGRAA